MTFVNAITQIKSDTFPAPKGEVGVVVRALKWQDKFTNLFGRRERFESRNNEAVAALIKCS